MGFSSADTLILTLKDLKFTARRLIVSVFRSPLPPPKKSMTIIHHSNKLKNKDHIFLYLDKIQYPFLIKISLKLRNKGNFLSLIEGDDEKSPTATSYSMLKD